MQATRPTSRSDTPTAELALTRGLTSKIPDHAPSFSASALRVGKPLVRSTDKGSTGTLECEVSTVRGSGWVELTVRGSGWVEV